MPMGMNDSILEDVRKLIGPSADCDAFDTDLIIHINSAFVRLYTLGIGVGVYEERPFVITGVDETWNDFAQEDDRLRILPALIYAKVRLIFDPPTSSFVLESLKNQIAEMEWQLLMMFETPALGGSHPVLETNALIDESITIADVSKS